MQALLYTEAPIHWPLDAKSGLIGKDPDAGKDPGLEYIEIMSSAEDMLKLKLQYFGHVMLRVDSLEKTLMLGGIGGRRQRGRQRMRWLDGITDSMDVSLSEPGSW